MDTDTENIVTRLRRVEGQLRGIQRMLEEGRICEDVVTQLVAARNAIDQVGVRVLELHIGRCVFSGRPVDPAEAEALREALSTWTRFGMASPPPLGSEPHRAEAQEPLSR
jgi:DNA-binding FrmR family transcriptional regulator